MFFIGVNSLGDKRVTKLLCKWWKRTQLAKTKISLNPPINITDVWVNRNKWHWPAAPAWPLIPNLLLQFKLSCHHSSWRIAGAINWVIRKSSWCQVENNWQAPPVLIRILRAAQDTTGIKSFNWGSRSNHSSDSRVISMNQQNWYQIEVGEFGVTKIPLR